jgi:hypothetical protein
MTAHSPIAPSAACRRWYCPASTMREAQFPEIEDSEESREGTATHWAGAEQANGRLVDVGVLAPNGVALVKEMADAADMWSDWLETYLKPFGMTPRQGYIERAIAIPRVHPQSWGTPDFFAWLPSVPGAPLKLLVADLKYGHGVVEVVENEQLTEYALGITDTVHDTFPGVEITFAIVQPRANHRHGPIRTWTTTLADLRAQANIATAAATEALGPNPRAKPGTHCRNCKARHACEELQRGFQWALDESDRSLPRELDADALSLELDLADRAEALLKARKSGLEEQALALLKAGKRVPARVIEHGAGREAWKVPDAQVIAVATAMGVNVAKPTAAITPKQAREAGLDDSVVKELAFRPPGEAKLVRVKDAEIRRVFKQFAGGQS